jgi:hypothetical protein
MHDVSSWMFLGGIVAGSVAVALIAAGLLLIGK